MDKVPSMIADHLPPAEIANFRGTISRFESATPVGNIFVYVFASPATCTDDKCLHAVHIAPNDENPSANEEVLLIWGCKLVTKRPSFGHASGAQESAVVQFEDFDGLLGVQFFHDGTTALQRMGGSHRN
jgi:hypothetical protein